MPAPEDYDRYQVATLWEFVGRFDRQGSPIVSNPIEINVRWSSVYRQRRNSDNSVVAIEVELLVGQDIPLHSAVAIGGLDTWGDLGTGLAGTRGDLMQVIDFRKMPSINGRVYERIVELARFKNKLPTIET